MEESTYIEKRKPEISIIVPVYKVEKYLDRCIQSILQQTFSDFELILVDDCSPDTCPVMCDNWARKDNRIRVIHKKNGGQSSARNAGLEIAGGTYIGFVDSDDWIEMEMYERLHQLIVQYDADMCLSQWESNNGSKKIKKVEKPRIELWDRKRYLDYFFRLHGERSNYSVWTNLFRKEFLNGFSFIEGKVNEDVLASYYFASNCNKVVYTNETFYNYFQNKSGTTKGRFTKQKMDLLDIWDLVTEQVREKTPEYVYACEMNKKRAYLTLLTRINFDGYDKWDKELQELKKELKRYVRIYFFDLLKWKIPLSRKILMFLLIL